MSTSDYTNTPPDPKDTPATILSPITQALNTHGITLDYTVQKLKESMEAHETKVFQGRDGLIYSDALIAHGIRLKASVEALKLQQAYPAEHTISDTTLTIKDVSDQLKDKIKANITKNRPPVVEPQCTIVNGEG